MSENLTIEALQEAYDAACGVLYYGTSDVLERGKVLFQEARPGFPQAIYCHPDDLEYLRQYIPQRLVHLREWMPSIEDTLEWSKEIINKDFIERYHKEEKPAFVMRTSWWHRHAH